MKNFKKTCLQPVLLAMCLIAVCGSANAADNIVKVADKAGTFKTLLAAAEKAGLAHTLQEDGPFTVFAPTDDAFAKLPSHTLNDLLKPENKEKLATILKYHVIPGKVTAKDAVQVGSAKTLSGDSVSISIRDGRLAVNDANVIVNDVEASNGIIHVIDSVLMPPPKNIVETAAAAGNFKTLLAAVEAAGLLETLKADGPFTVLAPSDEAFGKLGKETLASLLETKNKRKLRSVLEYHLIPRRLSFDDIKDLTAIKTVQGAEVRVQEGNDPFGDLDLLINQSNIISGDIDAANGIIHVIDSVLMPPEKPVTYLKSGADVALLTQIDPEFQSSLFSRSAGKKVSISFCNLSVRPILVYWIQPDGSRRQWRGEISPGKVAVCERTYENHVWLIADEHGEPLGLYIVGDQDAIIVNTR